MSILIVFTEYDHFSGPGWTIGPMCVYPENLLKKVTPGVDIWNVGSRRPYVGQIQRSRSVVKVSL